MKRMFMGAIVLDGIRVKLIGRRFKEGWGREGNGGRLAGIGEEVVKLVLRQLGGDGEFEVLLKLILELL
jgi:hypothetical protein